MPTEPTDEPLSTRRRLLIYFGLADAPGPRSQADRVRDGIQIAVAVVLIAIVLTGARGSAVTALIVVGVAILLLVAAWSAISRRRALSPRSDGQPAHDDGLDLRERARRAARERR
ncbi:MAG: hypothetical protein AAGC46_16525, partial [Solirubrobacteraceae bacterium]